MRVGKPLSRDSEYRIWLLSENRLSRGDDYAVSAIIAAWMGFIKTSERPVSYRGILARDAHACPKASTYVHHAYGNFRTASPISPAAVADDDDDDYDYVAPMNVQMDRFFP